MPTAKRGARAKTADPVATPLVAGMVYAAPVPDGRWTACQLISAERDEPGIVALDWLDEHPPTLEEARAAGLLRMTHHNWKGQLEYSHLDSQTPPPTWREVGVLPLPDLGEGMTHGGWPSWLAQVVAERRWLTEVPASARAAYKAATSMERVRLAPGALELELPLSTDCVELGSPTAPLLDDAELSWGALVALPRLDKLEVHGRGNGLVDCLSGQPLVSYLRWTHHGGGAIDLSRSYLNKVSIDVAEPLTLSLSHRIRELIVTGDPGALTVVHPTAGAHLILHVFGDGTTASLPRGLARAGRLDLAPKRGADVGAIAAAFPAVAELTVRDSTRLDAVEHLADLQQLEALVLYNCYRLDVAALPPATAWPHLRRVEIFGHRKADAVGLKARFGALPRFELRGGKTDDWLAANLDNPFRDWSDRNLRAGKVATGAWRKARAALPAPPATAKTEAILRAFIDTFNALETKQGLDTVDAEEVGAAFDELAKVGGVEGSIAAEWFETWRDF